MTHRQKADIVTFISSLLLMPPFNIFIPKTLEGLSRKLRITSWRNLRLLEPVLTVSNINCSFNAKREITFFLNVLLTFFTSASRTLCHCPVCLKCWICARHSAVRSIAMTVSAVSGIKISV